MVCQHDRGTAGAQPPPAPLSWRLVQAAAGVVRLWSMIVGGGHSNAGFAMKDFTWYQYLFTQFRTVFAYLFNFVLPVNLTVDWDFPISHGILDHGSIFGLAGLLAMAAAAWQCVAACDAIATGQFSAVNVSLVGANQQAIGVRFQK